MLMSQAAIAQSVAIAAMPTFSVQHALGRIDEMRASLAAALRGVLFLAIPASLGLMLLREPIVSLLYQRGQFDARMTGLVAWALLWYAAGLVGHSLMEVLTRAFYAQHDTRTPVVIGMAAMGLNVLFSFGFAAGFARVGWMPHGGLALANSLATALETTALAIMMRRRLNGMGGPQIWRAAAQASLGALAMGLFLWLWIKIPNPAWVITLAGIPLAAGFYLLVLRALKVPELDSVLSALRRAWERRFGRGAGEGRNGP
jgi:putative peptidoglycan lipid II flippase